MRSVLFLSVLALGCARGKVLLEEEPDHDDRNPVADADGVTDTGVAAVDTGASWIDSGQDEQPSRPEDTGGGLTEEPNEPSEETGTAPTDPVDDGDDDGFGVEDGDCDDDDPAVHPDAEELCNGVDDDCDTFVDEDVTTAFFQDLDGDDYGNPLVRQDACDLPTDYAAEAGDCNDDDASIHPDADELCNEVDDDCDDLIDEEPVTGGVTAYPDLDEDGHGADGAGVRICTLSEGWSEAAGDCDDDNDAVHPGAEEVCDGIDNDCEGGVDAGFLDSDGDGVANCVDDTVYVQDFSSGEWGAWASRDLGGYNPPSWTFSDGHLVEDSDAANAIAYSPNLGVLDQYTVSVDMMSAGDRCNGMGMGFAQNDAGQMLLVQWLDPTDDYGWYDPGGHIRIVEFDADWEVLSDAPGSSEMVVEYATWTTMSVTVDEPVISIFLDDELVFEYAYTGSLVGPARVSVWSHDADSGVHFDNVTVTQP